MNMTEKFTRMAQLSQLRKQIWAGEPSRGEELQQRVLGRNWQEESLGQETISD